MLIHVSEKVKIFLRLNQSHNISPVNRSRARSISCATSNYKNKPPDPFFVRVTLETMKFIFTCLSVRLPTVMCVEYNKLREKGSRDLSGDIFDQVILKHGNKKRRFSFVFGDKVLFVFNGFQVYGSLITTWRKGRVVIRDGWLGWLLVSYSKLVSVINEYSY